MNRGHAVALAAVAALTALIYSVLIEYRTFGPEFCWFYSQNAHANFHDVVASYARYLDSRWYRPTPFVTVYWTLSRFLSWHGLIQWQAAYVASLFAACCAIYALVLRLFPRERLAAAMACAFFASHPAVLPSILLLSGFDFVHIIAMVLSVIWFLSAREAHGGRHSILWAASVICFLVALSAKEVAIAQPVFLVLACLILGPRLRRDVRMLAPYFAILGMYGWLHVHRMPAVSDTQVYRDRYVAARVFENLVKFPLWIAHVFGGTPDTFFQAFEQDTLLNNLAGGIGAILLIVMWIRIWRSEPQARRPLLLMVSWYAIFLAIPVYAGALLWHANLSLIAYAACLGVAVSRFVLTWQRRWWTVTLVALLGAYFVISGRTAIRENYERGPYRHAFAMNRNLLDAPPIPSSQLGIAPLLYLEDALNLGSWSFGADGNLFRLVYLRDDIQERTVPRTDLISDDARADWLAAPDAHLFRFDTRWRDATAEFRSPMMNRLPYYAANLMSRGKLAEAMAVLEPAIERPPYRDDAAAQDQLGQVYHGLRQYRAAIHRYRRALALQPGFRAAAEHRAQSCQDLRQAEGAVCE